MRKTTLRPLVVREIERLIAAKSSYIASRFGLQPADAEDMRQEAWIAVMQWLPRYNKAGGTLGTFLAPRIAYAMLDWVIRWGAGGLTGTLPEAEPERVPIDAPGGYSEDDDEDSPADRAYSPTALYDLLVDPAQEDALLAVADATSALGRLDTRTRNLLVLYFGLAGDPPRTLADLARRNRQPMSVIYRRIQRGLDSLRGDMEQQVTEDAEKK